MFWCQSVLCVVAVLLVTGRAVPTKGGYPVIKVPDECKDQHFCSIKPEGYDQLVARIKRNARINGLVPNYLKKYNSEKAAAFDLEQRTSTLETESHNCKEVIKRTTAYFHFNNKSNREDHDIVLQTDTFPQIINEVICENTGNNSVVECFQDVKFGSSNFRTTCEPIYAYRTLYVFNQNKTDIIGRKIMQSVACSCTVTDA